MRVKLSSSLALAIVLVSAIAFSARADTITVAANTVSIDITNQTAPITSSFDVYINVTPDANGAQNIDGYTAGVSLDPTAAGSIQFGTTATPTPILTTSHTPLIAASNSFLIDPPGNNSATHAQLDDDALTASVNAVDQAGLMEVTFTVLAGAKAGSYNIALDLDQFAGTTFFDSNGNAVNPTNTDGQVIAHIILTSGSNLVPTPAAVWPGLGMFVTLLGIGAYRRRAARLA